MKAEEFDKAIERGEIAPLYFFFGNEPYLIARAVRKLLAKAVTPGFEDFNLNVVYGNECNGGEIVETALTLPMFAERRVIHVKKASDLSTAAMDVLCGYVSAPSPTTCLLFEGEKVDQRKRFFSEIKKTGQLIEFKRPYENQLSLFIREEATVLGKTIEPVAVEFLIHLAGNNLQELVTQLEKVALYVGERKTLTIADVRTVVSDTRVDSVFDLSNAVGERNLAVALRKLQTILRDGEAPLKVLAMLTSHFRQLWKVRELIDNGTPPAEIGKRAGINPYFVKGVVEQAKRYSLPDLYRVFERLYETDLALKSGGGKPAGLMERLLLDFCVGRKSGKK